MEFTTLDWVDWFNDRLLEPIGYVPPAEYEARYYEQAAVARLTELTLRRSRYDTWGWLAKHATLKLWNLRP